MIQEFKVKNFLSIKDEVTLSFEATKEKNLRDVHVVEVAKGVNLLKLGIVYGKNASGKSNLINAFGFLRRFWFNISDDKEEQIENVPFLLDMESRKNPSEFALIFFKDGVRLKW